MSTNMPQFTCTGHRQHVLCVAWAPNGETFASADKSGEIRIWDPRTGKQQGQSMTGHKKWVTSLCFEPLHSDPRCRRLASSGKDNTIKIWDVLLGLCETTICGHTDSVECVKWGGTGLLYTASRDRTIKVWAVDGSGRSQHKLVRTLTGHGHRINTLALNCDYVLRTGSYTLSMDKAAVSVSDECRQEVALERYRNVVGKASAAAAAAAASAAAQGDDGSISSSSSSSEDGGERLVSGSDDFTLFMWQPQSSKVPPTFHHSASPHSYPYPYPYPYTNSYINTSLNPNPYSYPLPTPYHTMPYHTILPPLCSRPPSSA